MKYILAAHTNKLYEVLPHIDDFDCRLAAESIIGKISSKYQFSSPQEFHTVNGFKAKLPDTQFVSYKSAMQMMKEQPSKATNEQRSNNSMSVYNVCFDRITPKISMHQFSESVLANTETL
ncbi:Hypothetical predicted protein [Mytilus galloprovincialis]|uniref:Uncharacterized protein n=1 Tax=Mytilus galloprovincialis TaxID=29158 RepID=A0A8B6GK46_MYTGA|nr:Hypothetical predicted protein [Mytilus galloprovincialis]